MYGPPLDPRYYSTPRNLERSLLASAAVVVGLFLMMWVASHPLAGTILLASLVGLVLVTRRAVALIRCLSECGGFSFNLGGSVRITVTRSSTTDSCSC